MKLKLDSRTVDGLALPKGKAEEFAWDTELEGFACRLRRRRDGNLQRTWTAQYRANGHTRRVTLGTVEKVAVADARAAARKVLARVALGGDPQAEKESKRVQAARTFRTVVSSYLAAKQGELRKVSFRITKLYLTGPYFRPLQAMGIDEIAHPDVAACVSAITRTRSSHTAAAARRALSALFRWTMEEGWRTAPNPVIGTRKPVEVEPRDRVLKPAELVAILRACSDDSDYSKIIWLLALLGSRRQEVGGMKHSELDLDGAAPTWTLPKERSKNGRSITIPLPPTAAAIIRSVPYGDRDHLFGDRSTNGFTRWGAAKRELDQRLGNAVRAFRLHDFRRTFVSLAVELGIEPFHVALCINHHSASHRGLGSSFAVYDRSRNERAIKVALARWNEHLLALVEGRKAKLLSMPQKA
jgi:integrase